MGIVVNDFVKMDWEEEGWLQTKGKGRGKAKVDGVFIFASKVFKNTDNVDITVFFTDETAFVWQDESGDRWNAQELKAYIKKHFDMAFPEYYDEYMPVYTKDDGVNEILIKKYGLEEYRNEIIARVNDLSPLGEEFEYADEIDPNRD